ncbi:5'-methylthioadenosine/S-adenosylhomocysteine nucleosidase [Ottowia sp. VDI28]|uniref:5'-methylthioadenosine/S-adenosylhomocysteine nucleosidase n=1 Tax=Ottowia sp. VDI28 TaxID=3133968 RepID=UPI003C30397F
MKAVWARGLRGTLGVWMLGLTGLVLGLTAQAEPAVPEAPSASSPSGMRLESTPRIAVISAFAPELVLLHKAVREPRQYQVNGVTFTTGSLQGHPVLLFLSGISMVNATMNTQLALDRFNVSHILFSGIAGGVNPELRIGDVNVPERWGQHLEVLMARETAPGTYERPADKETMQVPGFGMLLHRAVRVVSEVRSRPEPQFWFPADPGLLALARGCRMSPCNPATRTRSACASSRAWW